MQGFIELNDVRFFAHHGVDEQERRVGNDYRLSLRIAADLSRAATTDALDDTFNYAELYEVMAQEMQQPSKLLEHVAGRIIRAIHARFPQCGEVRVRIAKLRPPIAAEIGEAVVEIIG